MVNYNTLEGKKIFLKSNSLPWKDVSLCGTDPLSYLMQSSSPQW